MINVSSAPVRANKPRALTCYICGRGYGTASLQIHLKQCEKLFLKQEALKPKNERRALPQRPAVFEAATDGSGGGGLDQAEAMQAYNDEAFKNYNEQALIPCEYCGRTFLPDSLKHHRRACNADKPLKRIGEPVRRGVKGPFQKQNMRPSTASALEQRRRRSSSLSSTTSNDESIQSAAVAPTSPTQDKPWRKARTKTSTNGTPTDIPITIAGSSDTEPVSHMRENLAEAQQLDRKVNNVNKTRRPSYDPLELLRGMCIDLLQRGYTQHEIQSVVDDSVAVYQSTSY